MGINVLDIERLNRQGKKRNRMCPELARSTPGAGACGAALHKVTGKVHRLGGMQGEARYWRYRSKLGRILQIHSPVCPTVGLCL